MATLHLTLKKKWFDMIASGEKKEEYREIKEYWKRRLVENVSYNHIRGVTEHYKVFEYVTFKNGYAKDAPQITLEVEDIKKGKAKPEWSDNWQGDVFIIKLGKIIKP